MLREDHYRMLHEIEVGRDTWRGESDGFVVRVLEELRAEGWLTLSMAERHPDGRRTYALTEKGRGALEGGPDE